MDRETIHIRELLVWHHLPHLCSTGGWYQRPPFVQLTRCCTSGEDSGGIKLCDEKAYDLALQPLPEGFPQASLTNSCGLDKAKSEVLGKGEDEAHEHNDGRDCDN